MKIRRVLSSFLVSMSLVASVPMMTGCEEVADALQGASDGETASALKQALQIGVTTAVNKLSSEGYMAEVATKIGLPEGAVTAFEVYNSLASTDAGKSIVSAVGLGDNLQENLVTAFNNAATDAAPKSAKILADEVTGLTIQDAKDILFGADNAATVKLETDTRSDLMAAFHPTITESMQNVGVGEVNAVTLWSKFAKGNNALYDALNSTAGKTALQLASISGKIPASTMNKISSVQPVDSDISDYVTGRALDGLFTKIAEKELGIRTNVAERTNDLLRRVFGQLDKN